MPSRLFDQLDVINISQGYTSGPSVTNCVPILTNTSFSSFSISGSGSDTNPAGSACGYSAIYTKLGTIDVTTVPAIPINAVITKISIKCPTTTSAQAHASGTSPAIQSGHILCNADFQLGGSGIGAGITADDVQAGPVSLNESNSAGGAFVDIIGPFTYAELLSFFTLVTLTLNLDVSASAQPGASSSASIDFDATISNFQVEIFYNTGPFSWYLQTHIDTIGGQPAIIVDDIITVDDGVTPPVGSTFYGTSTDFPYSIPSYNWYYPPTGTVINQPIPPGAGWKLQLVDHVGDLQFDMALESVIVLMTNPSGIYGLIEEQTHDTLYERFTGVPSINVKIPNPFAKTGFIP